MTRQKFNSLLRDIRACEFCAYHLHVPPKPVVQLHTSASVLVIAQAPGIRARESGRPFDDPSGDRLRSWLNVDPLTFYDEKKFAFMPMGFCYPGSTKGGDLPPCKECAPLWHPQILPHLRQVKLTLLVGTYAQRRYLNISSVTQAVENWRHFLPQFLPLPHPSWHNNYWLKKHSWFENELVPTLQSMVRELVGTASKRLP